MQRAEQIHLGLGYLLEVAKVLGTKVSTYAEHDVFYAGLDHDNYAEEKLADIASHMEALNWSPSDGGGKAAFQIYT